MWLKLESNSKFETFFATKTSIIWEEQALRRLCTGQCNDRAAAVLLVRGGGQWQRAGSHLDCDFSSSLDDQIGRNLSKFKKRAQFFWSNIQNGSTMQETTSNIKPKMVWTWYPRSLPTSFGWMAAPVPHPSWACWWKTSDRWPWVPAMGRWKRIPMPGPMTTTQLGEVRWFFLCWTLNFPSFGSNTKSRQELNGLDDPINFSQPSTQRKLLSELMIIDNPVGSGYSHLAAFFSAKTSSKLGAAQTRRTMVFVNFFWIAHPEKKALPAGHVVFFFFWTLFLFVFRHRISGEAIWGYTGKESRPQGRDAPWLPSSDRLTEGATSPRRRRCGRISTRVWQSSSRCILHTKGLETFGWKTWRVLLWDIGWQEPSVGDGRKLWWQVRAKCGLWDPAPKRIEFEGSHHWCLGDWIWLWLDGSWLLGSPKKTVSTACTWPYLVWMLRTFPEIILTFDELWSNRSNLASMEA